VCFNRGFGLSVTRPLPLPRIIESWLYCNIHELTKEAKSEDFMIPTRKAEIDAQGKHGCALMTPLIADQSLASEGV
jgi:hypothetical protein